MGFDPNAIQQIPQVIPEPEEILTWTQIAYYGAGALVALCIAYLKIRAIKNKKREED
jgi:hypothetical protein